MQLVLASGSPRRKELLALLGLSFDICTSEFPEHPVMGWSPLEQAKHFAREKARAVARVRPGDLILGSDTVIELDGQLLGKPLDLADARTMLGRLAGRGHQVHTGVAVCCHERGIDRVEAATTHVTMKTDIDAAYDLYVASREPLGKAGAYAIQGLGGEFVERIEGDYTTVVGLPLKLVADFLRSVGYPIPVDIEELYRRKPYANWSGFAV